MSALLQVRACFNHSREDLTDTEADLLNIGVRSLVELFFRAKFSDFILFPPAILFHTFNTMDMTKSQCLEKERLHQTKNTFEGLCLFHAYYRTSETLVIHFLDSF